MIKHIVLWSFRPQAEGRSKQENIELAREKLLGLKDSIPEVRSLEIGININTGQDALTWRSIPSLKTRKTWTPTKNIPNTLRQWTSCGRSGTGGW